jgi:hypothetical protein
MHFKGFKDLTLGKPKEKPGGGPGKENPSRKIALMEEKMNGRTKNLAEMAQKIQGLAGAPGGDEVTRPHGPLGELSIGPEDRVEDVTDILPVVEAETKDAVKVVEVSISKEPAPAAAAVAAPEPASAPAPADPGNPLSGLFSNDEEEENPLANLIKTLPDYTTHEIIEDLGEIKKIINEWQRK